MRTMSQNERLDNLEMYLLLQTNVADDMNGVGLIGMTNAVFLSQFIETREIMTITEMMGKSWLEQLQHLKDDLIKRGIGNNTLEEISSIQQLEDISAEEFEELFKPVWEKYPYRDEGFLRRAGMRSEHYSYCQWSQEWSINSSSVSCVIARYDGI